MENKIIIITSRFGDIPQEFEMWLKSAERNPEFIFYIITDQNIRVCAENIAVKKYECLDKFVSDVDKKLKYKSNIIEPYKTADLRPAYADIFEREIQEIYKKIYGIDGTFDFWGFADTDVILGNLNHFISDEILNKCDVFQSWGHFMLIRNVENLRTLYKRRYKNYSYYKSLRLPMNCMLEEGPFIIQLVNAGYVIDSKVSRIADIRRKEYRFTINWTNYQQQVFAYVNGEVRRYYIEDNSVKHEEYMYIHFMKRVIYNIPDAKDLLLTESGFYDFNENNMFRDYYSRQSYEDWKKKTNVKFEERNRRRSIFYKITHILEHLYMKRTMWVSEEKDMLLKEFYGK